MSSWLSCITEFSLNQDVISSLENTNNYKIKSFSNIKFEKTNYKIKKEVQNFLKKIYLQNKIINSNYFISVKTIKVIQKEQKQILFGSSFTKFSKESLKKLNKSSPLILFSKMQCIHRNNQHLINNKTTLTNHKLISKIFTNLSTTNLKYSTPYKSLIFKHIKKVNNHYIHETNKTFIKESNLKENKIPFFNEEKKEHDNHNSDHESNEQENDNEFITKILKTANKYISLSTLFSNKHLINKLPSFKANFFNPKKDKIIKPPKIPLPTIGIFALYYILTKQGIIADQTAHSIYKQEIEITHNEISRTYEKRLTIIRENINKEQAMARWGVLSKFISWLMSFIATVTACILIASGVGAIMGAVILSAGLFSLTNSILEITNGWNKISELLPTKNIALKKKTLGIIKISIGVISLILSIITVIWGGFSQPLRALQSITQAITGILTAGLGICIIGEAISAHNFYYGIANLKETERNLEKLYFKRKDLMEKADWDLNHLEKLFEDISYALDLHKETAMIDNSFYIN